MPLSPLYNEKEILKQIAAGDQQAFTRIVDHYWSRVYTVALTFIKSTHTAEDIVQEVFLKLWEKRESVEAIENFQSWLFIVARNSIINTIRKAKLRLDHELSDQLEDKSQLPEEMLKLKQLNELLEKGIQQLPKQQQLIYKLSRIEGLSHDEICQRLGVAKSTVKNSLVKALNFLRHFIRQQSDPFFITWAFLLIYI